MHVQPELAAVEATEWKSPAYRPVPASIVPPEAKPDGIHQSKSANSAQRSTGGGFS